MLRGQKEGARGFTAVPGSRRVVNAVTSPPCASPRCSFTSPRIRARETFTDVGRAVNFTILMPLRLGSARQISLAVLVRPPPSADSPVYSHVIAGVPAL